MEANEWPLRIRRSHSTRTRRAYSVDTVTVYLEVTRRTRARYNDRRVIAVFEPRSWSSRLAVFQHDYADAFAAADYVVIAAVFDSQKVTEKGRALNTDELIEAISQQGKPAFALPDVNQIV